jgi:hypothetical protein
MFKELLLFLFTGYFVVSKCSSIETYEFLLEQSKNYERWFLSFLFKDLIYLYSSFPAKLCRLGFLSLIKWNEY